MKNILAISGSTRENSSNEQILEFIKKSYNEKIGITIFDGISNLPHFDPNLKFDQMPDIIKDFHKLILESDGIIICSPEYVFSIPAVLKNSLEWCVSNSIFSKKKTGIVLASTSGNIAFESLQLILKTIEADIGENSSIIINGVRGKIDNNGNITDEILLNKIEKLVLDLIK